MKIKLFHALHDSSRRKKNISSTSIRTVEMHIRKKKLFFHAIEFNKENKRNSLYYMISKSETIESIKNMKKVLAQRLITKLHMDYL